MQQYGRTWSRVASWLMACALLLTGCDRTPPEQALRSTMREMQVAIEQRNVSALDDALAEDFIGPGGLDRTGARRMAQAMFLRYRDVGVNL